MMKFIKDYDTYINENVGIAAYIRKKFNKFLRKKSDDIAELDWGDPKKIEISDEIKKERKRIQKKLDKEREKEEIEKNNKEKKVKKKRKF